MSTGVGMSDCCLSGKVNSGTPKGKEEEIGGIPVYVSSPQSGSKEKSVVFLVDIFGWKFQNTRLLADMYADAGFTVYVPDVHFGDSLPIEFLDNAEPKLEVREKEGLVDKTTRTAKIGVTLGPWLVTHREAVSKPIIDKFIQDIRNTPGTNKVGTIGFCWGGRYSILSAHGDVDAAAAFHPSLVTVPGDFEGIKKPIYIAVGDKDSLLPEEQMKQIQDYMSENIKTPNEVEVYPDQIHGWALRSDWSSEKDKKAMDHATKQGINFFKKYLA